MNPFKEILIKIVKNISLDWYEQPINITKIKVIEDSGPDTIIFSYNHIGKDEIHEHEEILEDDYLDDCRAWLWEIFLIELGKEQNRKFKYLTPLEPTPKGNKNE